MILLISLTLICPEIPKKKGQRHKQAERKKQGFGELLYLYETYFGLNVKPEFRSKMKPLSKELLNSYPGIKALQMKPKRSGRLYNIVFKEISPFNYFL